MSVPIVIGGTSDGRFDRVAQLFKAIDDLKAENARLLDLIGRLAPDDGIWGYIDDEDETCEWCGEYKHLDHEPDCPWLEARKVLDEAP